MKKILDACCGSRMFWFDKQNPDVEFVDVCEFDDVQIWKSGDGKSKRYCSVHPTTIADFTELPFPDNSFYGFSVVLRWMCTKFSRRIGFWRQF